MARKQAQLRGKKAKVALQAAEVKAQAAAADAKMAEAMPLQQQARQQVGARTGWGRHGAGA